VKVVKLILLAVSLLGVIIQLGSAQDSQEESTIRGPDTVYSPAKVDQNAFNANTPQLKSEFFPETRQRLLTQADILGWPDANLLYAIAEIYARRGADFQNKNIKTHFLAFDWYTPLSGMTLEEVRKRLSPIEAGNLRFLEDARQKLASNTATSAPPSTQDEQGVSSEEQTDESNRPPGNPPPEAVLKVKGLYIGMKIADACDVLNKILKSSSFRDPSFLVNELGPNIDLIELQVVKTIYAEGGSELVLKGSKKSDRITRLPNSLLSIEADADQNVTEICFGLDGSDKLFNTSDLNASQFAQQFVDAYHVPSMTPFSAGASGSNLSGWEYLSPNGYRLRIYEDKSIRIKVVPKESERNFN